MPIPMHSLAVVGNLPAGNPGFAVLAVQAGVANVSGSGTVTTAVTFAEPLPANYAVFVTPSQAATAYVTGKTTTGFNVVLAATSVSAGTFDVLVVG